jgi:hypothetical protein
MSNRSPSYPSISLVVALQKAKFFHDSLGQADAGLKESMECWGYSSRSGTGHRLVAAMTSFGLFEVLGNSADRRLKLSDAALDGLFCTDNIAHRKSNAILQFVLNPRVYRILWERWGHDLPDYDELAQYLVSALGFNRKVVAKFLGDYVASIELAREHGLGDGESFPDEDETEVEFKTIDMPADQQSVQRQDSFDEDDFEFEFDTVDLLLEAKAGHGSDRLDEDDTNLEFNTVDLLLEAKPGHGPDRSDEDDTNLEFEAIDLLLEQGPGNPEIDFGEDDILLDPRGIEESGKLSLVAVSNNLDYSGKLCKLTEVLGGKEIARYRLDQNNSISLIGGGPINRKAIETLIDRLSESLESGAFDSPIDDQVKSLNFLKNLKL